MKHSMIAVLSMVAVAVLVFGAATQAETIFTTASLPSSSPGDYTLSVAQFNPALGTLNSVKFDASSLFTATLTAHKDVDTNQYITWAVEDPTIKLSAPDSSTLFDNELGWIEFVGTKDAPATGAGRVVIPKSPAEYSATKSLSGGGTQTLTGGDLSAYIGGGNVTLPFSATVPWFTLGTQGGNNTIGMVTLASADLTVTYDYAPIPEPGTLVLLVTAGLGVLAYAWRRRRS